MPAVSKSQFRYMQWVAHTKGGKKGLSKAEAEEYVAGQSPKGLPEFSKPKRKKK
jgi:hypothetical protein